MSNFRAAPKPGPKRRGRKPRRSKTLAQSARNRDGGCLIGLFLGDTRKCIPGFDPHHIKPYGADPHNDVLENMICACRYHHQRAQAHFIPQITQQGILYHFYRYGPDDHIVEFLDDVRWKSSDAGYTTVFYLLPGGLNIKFIGTFRRFERNYTWKQTGMMEREVFLRDLTISFTVGL